MADTKQVLWDRLSGKYENFVSELRRDIIDYISTNKLTEEDILQCISKIIVTGEVEFSIRLQFLIVLQENSSLLLTSDERLEVTVSSLINHCEQLKSVSHNFLKGQILATITTMLLSYEYSITEIFASLLSKLCDQLWQILQVLNNKDNCLLREIAIECLLAIEESFPCIFLGKLDEISIMCFKENLYPFQSFSSLISCILKNAATFETELRKNEFLRTNQVLAMMKKLPLTDDINHYASHSKVNSIATKLLDFTPLLSCSSIHYVVSNLVHLLGDVFKLNPLILKTFVHRYMLTSDTILFDLLLRLKDTFKDSLFSKDEQDALMMLLIYKCNASAFTETNCLLALSCVRQYMDKLEKDLRVRKDIIESAFYLPQPLDTLRLKENKLRAFSKLLPYVKDMDYHRREFLESINGIYHQLSKDSRGHYVAALCRILYYCTLSQNEPIMEAEYQRISLSVVKHHPHFSMHILNLMKKIRHFNPKSMFFNNVLSTAVHHVTSIPVERVHHQLHHYLLFLAEAALENSEYSQPKAIVRFLQKILDENGRSATPNNGWLIGHAVLNVCKHILCYHNSNNIYADLGEVLHMIAARNDDIDVRDRAQLYYMLLTTLSTKKITAMFQQKIHKSTSRSTFTNFAQGDTAAYGIPAPVFNLNQPLLCLTRIFDHDQETDFCDKDCVNVDLDGYLQWLTDYGYCWKASLECSLSIISDSDDTYDEIYGSIVSFVGPSFCATIPPVSVPYLTRSKSHTFSLEVQTLEARLTQISVSAVFSTSKGQTCSNKLKPLVLEFHDLFQPLPVPSCHIADAESWRQTLANNLWDKFTSALRNKGSCGYHQSISCLLIEENTYAQLLVRELKAFVTDGAQSCPRKSATVGIFLPPKNHLIMKICYTESEGMVARMAADSPHILPQVCLYFRKLENKYSKSDESRSK